MRTVTIAIIMAVSACPSWGQEQSEGSSVIGKFQAELVQDIQGSSVKRIKVGEADRRKEWLGMLAIRDGTGSWHVLNTKELEIHEVACSKVIEVPKSIWSSATENETRVAWEVPADQRAHVVYARTHWRPFAWGNQAPKYVRLFRTKLPNDSNDFVDANINNSRSSLKRQTKFNPLLAILGIFIAQGDDDGEASRTSFESFHKSRSMPLDSAGMNSTDWSELKRWHQNDHWSTGVQTYELARRVIESFDGEPHSTDAEMLIRTAPNRPLPSWINFQTDPRNHTETKENYCLEVTLAYTGSAESVHKLVVHNYLLASQEIVSARKLGPSH